ncbi:MAG: right-handed parallel beta-helix repeat-containing protein, partial [Thermoplasmata archaeon]|nr:right-handed parallel beta-helix repeat-containing protein [Thermoplasmata archaeon]
NNISNNNRSGIYLGNSEHNALSNNTCNSNNWYGIHLYYSDYNTISNNNISNNNRGGIYLRYSDNNTLSNNNISNNDDDGINVKSSNNNILSNNNISNNNRNGIYLRYSDYNTLTNNTCNSNNHNGIYLITSNHNTLTNTTILGNRIGIYLHRSSSNNIAHYNNIFNNTEYGINATDNDGCTINATYNWWGHETGPYHPTNNSEGKGDNVTDYVEFDPWLTAPVGEEEPEENRTWYVDDDAPGGGDGSEERPFNKIQDGVDAAEDGDTVYIQEGTYCENIEVYNQINLIGKGSGVTFIDGTGLDSDYILDLNADNIAIDSISIINNEQETDTGGIRISSDVRECRIENCTLSGNENAIYVTGRNHRIANDLIEQNQNGIWIADKANCSIDSCIVKDNTGYGVYITNNANLRDNRLSGNGMNFYLPAWPWGSYFPDMDETNVINGKPVFYRTNYNDSVIDVDDWSVIYLSESSNVVIRDGTLGDNAFGIFLWRVEDITIENVKTNNTRRGLYVFAGRGIDIRNCEFSNSSEAGAYVTARYVNMTYCKFFDGKSSRGLHLNDGRDEGYTTVENCTFHNWSTGLTIHRHNNNVFSHNQFSQCGNGIFESGSNDNTFTYNRIVDCDVGLHVYHPGTGGSGYTIVRNNNIHGNAEYGLDHTNPDQTVDARYNWWGDPSGPYHEDDNPDGQGDEVADDVDFSNWLGYPFDVIPPAVISTVPENGEKAVAVDTEIEIEFNHEMDKDSVENAIYPSPVFGYSVSWHGNTLTLTPDNDLESSTEYTIIIDKSAQDTEGWELEEDFTLTFTTEDEKIPPEVLYNWPGNGFFEVPVNSGVIFVFSESMNKTSVIENVEADFEFNTMWDAEGPDRIFYLLPIGNLLFDTEYSYGFSEAPTDLAGNHLVGWEEVTFTTEKLFINIFEPEKDEVVSGDIIISGNAS